MYFRAQGFTKEQNKVIRSELPILHYMSLGENLYMTPYPAGAGAAEAGASAAEAGASAAETGASAAEAGTATGGCG